MVISTKNSILKWSYLLLLAMLLFYSCRSKLTATQLNNNGYTSIYSHKNTSIDTLGTYVAKDTLPSLDPKFKDDVTTRLLRFNTNKTVQFSTSHNNYKHYDNITNENLTDWIYNWASAYYYLDKNQKLVIEWYEEGYNPRNNPWIQRLIPAGPPTGPYHNKIIFAVKGDSLIRGKSIYILDRSLTNNHKFITNKFKIVNPK